MTIMTDGEVEELLSIGEFFINTLKEDPKKVWEAVIRLASRLGESDEQIPEDLEEELILEVEKLK